MNRAVQQCLGRPDETGAGTKKYSKIGLVDDKLFGQSVRICPTLSTVKKKEAEVEYRITVRWFSLVANNVVDSHPEFFDVTFHPIRLYG